MGPILFGGFMHKGPNNPYYNKHGSDCGNSRNYMTKCIFVHLQNKCSTSFDIDCFCIYSCQVTWQIPTKNTKQRNTPDRSDSFSRFFCKKANAIFRSGHSSLLKHSSQQHSEEHSFPARKHSQYLRITISNLRIQLQAVCLLARAVNRDFYAISGRRWIIR